MPAARPGSDAVAAPELSSHLNCQLRALQESLQDRRSLGTPCGESALNTEVQLAGRSCWQFGGSGHVTAALAQERFRTFTATSASHTLHTSATSQTTPFTGSLRNDQARENKYEGAAPLGPGEGEELSSSFSSASSAVDAKALAALELRDWSPSASGASLAHCQGPEDVMHQGAGGETSLLAQSYEAVTDNVAASLDAFHSLLGLPW